MVQNQNCEIFPRKTILLIGATPESIFFPFVFALKLKGKFLCFHHNCIVIHCVDVKF